MAIIERLIINYQLLIAHCSLLIVPMLPSLVLASASSARHKLLKTAGFNPIICPSNFDESKIQEHDPEKLVITLAQKKAQTVFDRFNNALILGCDSILKVRGQIYGKPKSPEYAIERWQEMRGQIGLIYTGHALYDLQQKTQVSRCGVTKVFFANINDSTIKSYVNTGEPLKCAGSFALEGKGSLFIEKIEGCHSNVIGLSLPLLHQMLEVLGYRSSDFWEQ